MTRPLEGVSENRLHSGSVGFPQPPTSKISHPGGSYGFLRGSEGGEHKRHLDKFQGLLRSSSKMEELFINLVQPSKWSPGLSSQGAFNFLP